MHFMATLPFDTHKAVKDLQEAGFDEAQAEAVVATVGAAIFGNVATKQDVAEARNASKSDIETLGSELRSEMQAQGNELRSEMQAQGSELRSEMQAQGSELRSDIQTQGSGLRSEMQAMELRMTLRMGGLVVAGVGLIIALDKLL